MSIRTKFILILAFSLSAMALGTSVAVHLFAVKETDASFSQNAAVHMDRVEDIIHAHFTAGSEAVKTLADLPEASDDALLRDNGNADSTAKNALLRRLESLRAVVPGVEAVFCGYRNGLFLASPEGSGNSPEDAPAEDVRKRGWYSDAFLGTAQFYVTDAYISNTTKSLAATIAAKIKNSRNEAVGAAAASVSLASLTDTLRDIQMGKGGYLVLFDSQSHVILDPKAQENLLQPAGSARDTALATLAQLPAGIHTVSRGGTEYAAYARSLPLPRWKAVILMDKSVLMGTANSLTLSTVLVALAVLCLAFALGSLAAIGATRPLLALIRQSSTLADGNLDALEGISGRGPDITVIHGNLGRLTGRIMLLLQAEKERADETKKSSNLTAESRREAVRAEASLREAHLAERSKIINTITPIASELATLVETLSDKSSGLRTEAEKQLHSADEVRVATMNVLNDTTTFARQATETEANADASLSLAAELGSKVEETARGLDAAKSAVFALAGNLESMKTDITEMAEMTASVRDLAEQANLLGFNVSLDVNSTGNEEKNLASIVEKIQAVAENAMTAAGTVDAVTASLEQQHASQVQALNKSLSALKRASSGNAKIEKAASTALAASATTVEQFRVLATALEGAAHAGNTNAEHADSVLRSARAVVDFLQEFDASVTMLTTLSARLALTVEELGEEKQLD